MCRKFVRDTANGQLYSFTRQSIAESFQWKDSFYTGFFVMTKRSIVYLSQQNNVTFKYKILIYPSS